MSDIPVMSLLHFIDSSKGTDSVMVSPSLKWEPLGGRRVYTTALPSFHSKPQQLRILAATTILSQNKVSGFLRKIYAHILT